MSRKRVLALSLTCAAVVVIGLLVAGSRSQRVRTFALRSPNQIEVALLRPGARVCEGPVQSDGAFQAVRVWGASAAGRARLTVQVKAAGLGQVLASGTVDAVHREAGWTAALDRIVGGNRAIVVCLTENANEFSLAGYPPVLPVTMSAQLVGPQPGPQAGQAFSLVLLSPRDRSWFDALSTAFSRASLWRPSWVGRWTFWLLTVALLGTFGLAAFAAVAAADEDAGPPPAPPDEDGPLPPSSEHSETGQDRPQPVS